MVQNTPPLNAAGIFQLSEPWRTEPNTVYVADAISGFSALEQHGVDVYKEYYLPKNVSKADYESDLINDINIVTLISDTAPTIFVPDSYIISFPRSTNVSYNQVYLNFAAGLLPDGFNLDSVIAEAAAIIADRIGTDKVDGKMMVMPSEGIVDMNKHQKMETARRAKMKLAHGPIAELRLALEREASFRQRIAELEKIVIRLS